MVVKVPSSYNRFFEKNREFVVSRTRLTVADPKYLLRRSKRMVVQTYAERYSKGRLIDLGCGTAGFKRFFNDHVRDYIRFDYPTTKASMGYGGASLDIAGDIRAIPFKANCMDSALLLDVLEHVFEVEAVLEGISRILKPGGTLLLTTPFIYPIHGKPYDFHRFSFYALENHLAKYSLKIIERVVMGGYGTVLATLVNRFLFRVFWGRRGGLYLAGLLLRPLLLLTFVFINCVGYILDVGTRRHPVWVYLENAVVCEKV